MPNLSLYSILIHIPGILIGLSFHEFAHAFMSDRMGDPTPRSQGRLTLSPIPHIDIIGFLLILIAGFGWAKPVQVNPRYYKNPKRDDILVSIAGPITNLIVAFVFTILLKILYIYALSGSISYDNIKILGILEDIFRYAISINIILFLFNLIPLPPLDGFHVLSNLVSSRYYKLLHYLEQYSTIILIIIIVTPAISFVLGPPYSFINDSLLSIFKLPF